MHLYPLKFKPVFKYRIWGGNKIQTVLNKKSTIENLGESWEISGLTNDETFVKNGPLKGRSLPELIEEYKSDLIGKDVYSKFGLSFPLLIKFIDALQPLSIQVHPNDEVAKKNHNSFGKNEMWYILEAEEDAELIVGFKRDTDKNEISRRIKEGELTDVLNVEKVKKGDVFYIPTGRVHAIGKGVTLVEIQQTSDITYRVYDYNRIEAKTGSKRELHIDEALEVLDYSSKNSVKTYYEEELNMPNKLIHSPYFKTNFLKIKDRYSLNMTEKKSFRILIGLEGFATFDHMQKTYSIEKGETILIPACIDELLIISNDASIIEVYL